MSTSRERTRELRATLLSSNTAAASSVPHDINVTSIIAARVQEISKLSTSVSTSTSMRRVYQQLVRHKRRRAMAHEVSRIPKVLREAGYREMLKSLSSCAPPLKSPHRNLRRSKQMRLINHLFRAQANRWFETHHYHAKRAHMRTRWGYRVPVVTNDKGLRGVEKFAGVKAVVSDQSHLELVDLFAPTDLLVAALTLTQNYYNTFVDHVAAAEESSSASLSVLPPYALSRLRMAVGTMVSPAVMQGTSEVSAVLRFPTTGALVYAAQALFPTLSRARITAQLVSERLPWTISSNETISIASNLIVAPVRIQWIPIPLPSQQLPATNHSYRTVWCWVHPSATHIVASLFQSVLSFLSRLHAIAGTAATAAAATTTSTTAVPQTTVHGLGSGPTFTVGLMSGHFSRFAVRGPKSTTILGRILSQVTDPGAIDLDAHMKEKYSNNTDADAATSVPAAATTAANTVPPSPPTAPFTPSSNRLALEAICQLPPDPHSIRIWNQICSLAESTSGPNAVSVSAPARDPSSSHLNTSSQIPPNHILALKVFDPHSSLHRAAQKSTQSGGRGVLAHNQAMSQMFRTHDNGPRFRVDKQLCVSATIDASFDRNRIDRNVVVGDVSGNQTSPALTTTATATAGAASVSVGGFQPAGDIMAQQTSSSLSPTTLKFLSAQWTPMTSSSHPQRYNPPIPPAGAQTRSIGQLLPLTNDLTPDTMAAARNTQPDDGTAAAVPRLTKTAPAIAVSPLYQQYYLDQLIQYSPGNITAFNCARHRGLVNVSLALHHPPLPLPPSQPSPSLPAPHPSNYKKMAPSPTTHVLLVSRSPTASQYQSTACPHHQLDPKSSTLQLQHGWDLIVPRGWARSFFTALCKNGGAVMIGHDQEQTLSLEAQNFHDTFPHNSTFPNSLPGALVDRANRWDRVISAIRHRKFTYSETFAYGALGPAYHALFSPTTAPDPSTKTPAAPVPSPSTVVNHSGRRYSNLSPLCLPPPQQLRLLGEIRHWICRLVRHNRSLRRKTARVNRRQGHDWLRMIQKCSKQLDTTGPTPAKRARSNQLGEAGPIVALSANTTPTTTTTTTTTPAPRRRRQQTTVIHPKSISPIPNLHLFTPSHLPRLPTATTTSVATATLRNPVNLSSHSQVSSAAPLFSTFVGSSRRSLALLLNSANDFSPKPTALESSGQQATPTHDSQARALFRRRVTALLTSPHSPYYLPPLLWLHKRTYQNQAFLKPIVLHGAGPVVAGSAAAKSVPVFPVGAHVPSQRTTERSLTPPLASLDQTRFEVTNLRHNFLVAPYNPQFATSFTLIDNIYYGYPILLNTMLHHEAKHRNTGSWLASKPGQKKPATTSPKSGTGVLDALYTALPRLRALPRSIANLFVDLINQGRAVDWIVQRQWLIDAIILLVVIQPGPATSLVTVTTSPTNPAEGNRLLPVRFEQLSLGHVSPRGVATIPTTRELSAIFQHQYQSLSAMVARSKANAIPPEYPGADAVALSSSISSTDSEMHDMQRGSESAPIGFVTHTHYSMKLGKPYGLGFVSVNGYAQTLERVLAVHHIVLDQTHKADLLAGLGRAQHNTLSSGSPPEANLITFDSNVIAVPMVVHGESNKKLHWVTIRLY